MSTDKRKTNWPGWETVEMIGRGSFGAVYKIRRDVLGDSEEAALKVISVPQNPRDIEELYSDGYDEASVSSTFQSHLKSIVAEYTLMRKMNGSSNIVSCDDIRYIQHSDGIGWDISIKMELLTPLPKALPTDISESTVIKVAKDLCSALDLCNKHGIIHRDIKPQNIFVSPNGDYKLGDFGIAKTVEKTMGGTRIGTYKYIAPEVFNNQPYGHTADIYSLGLVLYWMLNERRMPFLPLPPATLSAGMDEQARNRRLSGEKLPPPAHGSEELKQIVLKACAYAPKERYQSAHEMLDALNALQPEAEQIGTAASTSKKKTAVIIAAAAAVLVALAVCISVFLSGSRNDPKPSLTPSETETTMDATTSAPVDAITATGTCGDNLTWELDADGTLTISGAGSMTNFQSAAQVPWVDYTKNIRSVVIENGVTSIGGHAFYACEKLVNVSIPDSVTDIRGIAFCGCTSLTEISLPTYLAGMGGYVFSDCTSLSSIVIPQGLTVIPAYTFRNCTSLKEIQIPGTITAIQPQAFSECTSLKRVYYGASQDAWKAVTVGDENTCLTEAKVTFDSYTVNPEKEVIATGTCGEKLTWTLNKQGTLIISGTGTMTNFPGASEIPWRSHIDDIHVVIIEDGVTGIGGHAFYNCSNLASVLIPDSVTDIRGFAFSHCISLTAINLPDSIKQMGGYVFNHCTGLTHVALPANITVIPGQMFSGCTALESVSIPKSVKEIQGAVFDGCDALREVYYGANAESWKKLKIGSKNDALSNAEIHYGS